MKIHLTPDLTDLNLKILFCGTALSAVSAKRKAYYAGPGNAFWPTLFKIGLTPHQFRPEDYRDLLPLGIGLTDMAKHASGADTDIRFSQADRERLRRLVKRNSPRILAFTSKRAAQEYLGRSIATYGVQPETIGDTVIFVLPSPSGRARRWWQLAPWRQLARISRAF